MYRFDIKEISKEDALEMIQKLLGKTVVNVIIQFSIGA